MTGIPNETISTSRPARSHQQTNALTVIPSPIQANSYQPRPGTFLLSHSVPVKYIKVAFSPPHYSCLNWHNVLVLVLDNSFLLFFYTHLLQLVNCSMQSTIHSLRRHFNILCFDHTKDFLPRPGSINAGPGVFGAALLINTWRRDDGVMAK